MDIANLNLERFSGYGSKVSRRISITRSFGFGFPPAFCREHDLNRFAFAALFYDKSQRVIGIQFLAEGEKDPDQGAFRVVHYGVGDRTGASFTAKSFFNEVGLNVDESRGRYEGTPYPKMPNTFLLDLSKPDTSEAEPETGPESGV